MRIGVHGRAMEAVDAPVLMRTIEQMTAFGLEPVLTKSLATWLAEVGHPVPWTVLNDDELIRHRLALFVSLGGDGTLLDTVSLVGRSEIPILGINLGRLGFLSNVRLDTVEKAMAAIRDGRYALQDRALVEVVDHPELLGAHNFALNEVSIHKQDSASMIAVHVHLADEFLNTYWADGLIIATPTGSTAYSLSCGGPVVFPTSDALVINPICPHNLNVRPFVVPDHFTIRLQLEARTDRCLLNLDSRSVSVDGQSTITIQRAKFAMKMVQFEDSDFLDTLRKKLSWGLDVRSSAPKG
ncbi:MAG: NAD kinase [Flavobacteriales bacterium]|jgi:NAD+ kinase|nr:NAD kinase [Flavobacteriales bacterium]MBK6881857.1 NAD kinase [Flavobacteriales bacterium]MBK7102489.1 NAD kinase [Flavobacteriales bacterium]MBK7482776.1 NAD kinase [Flavobacteriales bacterium]MBK7619465.1 NAD kinase [Flavobacteriales bacterium]